MRCFKAECIDKLTGRAFGLRLLGGHAEEARSVADAWGFITGPLTETRAVPLAPSDVMKLRGGKAQDGGQVAAATASLDFERMLAARDCECHPVDRHFLLQQLAEEGYRRRAKRADALALCETLCWQWLIEAPILLGPLQREYPDPARSGGLLVTVLAPKRLAILLEKDGFAARAAEVCRVALRLPLCAGDLVELDERRDKLERKAAAAVKKKGKGR